MQRALTHLERTIAEEFTKIEPVTLPDEIEEIIAEEVKEFLKNDAKSWEMFFQGFFSVKAATLKGQCATSAAILKHLEDVLDPALALTNVRILTAKAKEFLQHKDPGALLDGYQQKTLKDQKALSCNLAVSTMSLDRPKWMDYQIPPSKFTFANKPLVFARICNPVPMVLSPVKKSPLGDLQETPNLKS